MSRTVDRYQNPVVGDTIKLRLITYNSNNPASVYEIDRVEIWQAHCDEKTCDNPEGALLVETCRDCVVTECTGEYLSEILLDSPKYTIGNYHDIWFVRFKEGDELSPVKQNFQVYPDLWITSPTPAVYGFDFRFTPNRIRRGSKKFLIIQVTPNVPRATDLERYYQNLAISADLRISISQNCGACVPQEADLRLVVDNEPVTVRDKSFSYYKIDTTDWDCGIYDVSLELRYADSVEISPVMQVQIY